MCYTLCGVDSFGEDSDNFVATYKILFNSKWTTLCFCIKEWKGLYPYFGETKFKLIQTDKKEIV